MWAFVLLRNGGRLHALQRLQQQIANHDLPLFSGLAHEAVNDLAFVVVEAYLENILADTFRICVHVIGISVLDRNKNAASPKADGGVRHTLGAENRR